MIFVMVLIYLNLKWYIDNSRVTQYIYLYLVHSCRGTMVPTQKVSYRLSITRYTLASYGNVCSFTTFVFWLSKIDYNESFAPRPQSFVDAVSRRLVAHCNAITTPMYESIDAIELAFIACLYWRKNMAGLIHSLPFSFPGVGKYRC